MANKCGVLASSALLAIDLYTRDGCHDNDRKVFLALGDTCLMMNLVIIRATVLLRHI